MLLLPVFIVTSAIAVVSVFYAGHAGLQRRVLPVAGGVLLGIGLFWILPEMAEDRGWGLSLLGVGTAFGLQAWVDQKV